MDVILLQKVANLGNIGDRVKVKSGYGRNFLLPKGQAIRATDGVASQAASMRRARCSCVSLAGCELQFASSKTASPQDWF